MKKKFHFLNSKIILVHFNSNFCKPQQVKEQQQIGMKMKYFSEIKSIIPGVFKNSRIKIELIFVY